MMRDKIRGMFLGVAIGDALGMAQESKPYEALRSIKKRQFYRSGRRLPKGSWTDDTQLTIAVAQAILDASRIDMDVIASQHVKAYQETVSGWGSTTREAVKKISEGIHWSESGKFDVPNRGLGNGIPMKAAPLAAYFAFTNNLTNLTKILVDFTAMTHQTSVAVSSCFAHVIALYECLSSQPTVFDTKDFLRKVIRQSELGRCFYSDTLGDDLTDRLKTLLPLYDSPNLLYDTEHIVKEYNGGTCYVYNSLPFAYAFFIRSPFSMDGMIEAAFAGGDTDTNASFVGSLIGALCGESVFSDKLKDELRDKEKVIELADMFCDKFGETALQATKL